jgi:hypothetical protein
VGLLNNLGNPVAPPQWEATRAVASKLRLAAELFDVRSEADIVQAFSTMVDKRLGLAKLRNSAHTQVPTMLDELHSLHSRAFT